MYDANTTLTSKRRIITKTLKTNSLKTSALLKLSGLNSLREKKERAAIY